MTNEKTTVIIEMENKAAMIWRVMQSETNEIRREVLRKAYYQQVETLKKQRFFTNEIGKK